MNKVTLSNSKFFKKLDTNDCRLFRFITITFSKTLEKSTPQRQFQATAWNIYRRLYKCSKRFNIYPELTLQNRIHYHIIVLIDDYISFSKTFMPYINKLGFVNVKKVRDYEGVKKYCNKDTEDMQNILDIELPLTQDSKSDVKNYKTDIEKKDLDNMLDKYFI